MSSRVWGGVTPLLTARRVREMCKDKYGEEKPSERERG